jgi:tetratricopeptide (TPR) repeat protein
MKLLRWNDQHREALELALNTVEIENLKPVDTLELKSTISLIYHELGDNKMAESMEREILDIYGSDEWKGDTSRLDSEINLVDILITRGQCENAKELGVKAVQECITELGIHHSTTKAARRSLAAAYSMCGELVEALQTTEELVQSEEQPSDVEHVNPKLVEDVSRLGVLYYRLDKYRSAMSCYGRVQQWIKSNIANAAYAVISVNNQATKLIQQGAMSEAKPMLEALLRECTDVLGFNNEETALVMGNLEFIYHSEREWSKAEQLGKQVIDMRREILGPSHPKTLTAMGNYRALFLEQKKYSEAVKVAKEEIASVKNSSDATAEAVVDAVITVCGAFESAGAYEEAISVLGEGGFATDSEDQRPKPGIRLIVQEAICYLHLGQIDKAQEVLSNLFSYFRAPFKEDLNVLSPELLRLTKTFLLQGCMVEADQVLNAVSIFSQKSTNVTDEVKDEIRAMALEYHDWKVSAAV